MARDRADAVVIGSGHNGLVAACLLARAGWSVVVLERGQVAGGAVHSEESTLPGFIHDSYSAFYALLQAAPVFTELGLDQRVGWANFEIPVAGVSAPGAAGLGFADFERTVEGLAGHDPRDAKAWKKIYGWWMRSGRHFLGTALAPVGAPRPALRFITAAGPVGAASTARMLLEPLRHLTERKFHSEPARVLFAGGASHSDLTLESRGSTPAALILAMVAQRTGMPIPIGGSSKIVEALLQLLAEAGGELVTEAEVKRIVLERGKAVAVETTSGSFRADRAILANAGPKQVFLEMLEPSQVPSRYLEGIKKFRYGSGMFRLDLALDGAPPWNTEGLDRTGVIHLTGTLEQMSASMQRVAASDVPDRPNLIVGQQSIADPSRAPAGKHTLWIETQVPPKPRQGPWSNLEESFTDTIVSELERHAPGLAGKILATKVRTPDDLEAENPNLVGGDPGGGALSLDQQLIFRPVRGWFRYRTPVKGLYLCSASAHPGGGVHGMAGRNCAERVLKDFR